MCIAVKATKYTTFKYWSTGDVAPPLDVEEETYFPSKQGSVAEIARNKGKSFDFDYLF